MIYGYARVSTKDQNLDLQVDALQKFGCEEIYTEKVSARNLVRKELEALLVRLSKNDLLVVWKLDRLGRRTLDLIKIAISLNEKGIQLVSVSQYIDTRSPLGMVFFQLIAIFAEMETENLKERTLAGIRAARAKGRIGGRPKGLSKTNNEKAALAYVLWKQGGKTRTEICATVGISKNSYYRYLNIFKKNNGL